MHLYINMINMYKVQLKFGLHSRTVYTYALNCLTNDLINSGTEIKDAIIIFT